MKGYWHIAALAAASVIFCKIFDNKIYIILFCLWLIFIFVLERLPFPSIIPALLALIIFYLILPDQQMPVLPFGSKEKPAFHKGTIVSAVEKGSKKISFSFRLDQNNEKVLAINFPEGDEKADITTLKHGAYCSFQAVLETPDPATNPGEFDFAKHLRRSGFERQLVIENLQNESCTGQSKWAVLLSARGNFMEKSDAQLDPFTSGWLKALVLGDDGGLPEEVVELFQRWSLSHLLAISGLHIGLVAAILYYIFAASGLFTKEKAQWAIAFLLPLYAFVAGGQPSVWRASLMTVLVILLYKVKASLKTSDIISIVFLLLLLISPTMMNNVGFQLSFVVSFGIILSQRWLGSSDSLFLTMLKLGFVSQMMILPLQISYFHQIQPLSILLNMIVVPYFSFFVIPVMFILFLLLFIPLTAPIVVIVDRIFSVLHPLAVDFVFLIDAYLDYPLIPGEGFIKLAPIYLLLFILFMNYLQQMKRIRAFVIGTAMTGVLMLSALMPYLSDEGRVTMLDIGQGDAFIVELPYRKGVIFIDAGASFSFETMEPSSRVYKQVIGPYLKHRGIRHIDAMFLSHEDLDHDGSLPFIAEEVSVGSVIISPIYEPPPFVKEAVLKKGIEWDVMGAGESRQFGDIVFHAIGPLSKTESANENSLILYTEIGGKSWMFTGDAGHPSERELLETYSGLTADILKVGHHGSKNSTEEQFVSQIAPEYALFSAGRNNRYGHPAPEVLDILRKNGAIMLRTDQSGAIIYRFRDKAEGTFLPYRP